MKFPPIKDLPSSGPLVKPQCFCHTKLYRFEPNLCWFPRFHVRRIYLYIHLFFSSLLLWLLFFISRIFLVHVVKSHLHNNLRIYFYLHVTPSPLPALLSYRDLDPIRLGNLITETPLEPTRAHRVPGSLINISSTSNRGGEQG